MKKIWTVCLLPVMAVFGLAGCSTNHDLSTTKNMYQEMITTYQEKDINTMFTDWKVEPKFDEVKYPVFAEGVDGQPNSTVAGMSEDLVIAYSQLQYLYGNTLDLASQYINTYAEDIFTKDSVLSKQHSKINTLYNQVIALRKTVYTFHRSKIDFLEELQLLSSGSSILYEKLKNFGNIYGELVGKTLDVANTMKSLNTIASPQDLTVLDNESLEISVRQDMVKRIFDDAKLTYATIVYENNIDALQSNNSSNTFMLQYYTSGALKNYELSLIDEVYQLITSQTIAYGDFTTIVKEAKHMHVLQEKMDTYFEFYKEAKSKVDAKSYYEAKLKDQAGALNGGTTNNAELFYNNLTNQQKGCIDFIEDFNQLDVVSFFDAMIALTK